MVFSGLNLISMRSDVIMIGMFRGTEEAGQYVAAMHVASLISFALFSANAILAPLISELYHAGRLEDLQRMLRWAAGGIALCCIPLGLALLFLGSWLLGWWGPSFVQGKGALDVLILGWLVNALAGPVGFMMSMTGEHRRASVVSAVAACLNLCLNAMLIPRFGIYGAAVATTITFCAWNCVLYVMVLQIHGISPGILCLLPGRIGLAPAFRPSGSLSGAAQPLDPSGS
jgi:O-antigen/teichoic acid export membrane protein